MKLPLTKNSIGEYATRYNYQYTKNNEEIAELEVKNWLEKNKYLNKEMFMMLCLWKSKRPKKQYERNSEEIIEEITRIGLSIKSEEAKIKILMCLNGVSFPVASTILHFAHPDKYTIMDFRAIWSLGWEQPKKYTFEFWDKYYKEIQGIAKKLNVSIRTVDKALWQYSKENQK